MEYRRLGRSGVKVSAVSIGAWLTYGSSQVEEETSMTCLRTAIENDINFIDVADVYAGGEAEKVVGKVVKDYDRSKLVVSSKAFWPMSDDVNDRGLSRKHIIESVDKSLKRFGMDYLDIFFCHRYDDESETEETVRAIDDLIHQGKILYWGTSMWTASNIEEGVSVAKATGSYLPVTEQPLYNMLERSGVEGDLEAACLKHGMGLVVFSPLAMGLLTGKYNDGIPADSRASHVEWFKNQLDDGRIDKVRQLSALAAEMSVTVSALALAWALKGPAVSSVITGASKPAQVIENLKALEIQITPDLNAKIEAILGNKPTGSLR